MTETEYARQTNWRFKVLQRAADSRSVARTCRHFGLSGLSADNGHTL